MPKYNEEKLSKLSKKDLVDMKQGTYSKDKKEHFSTRTTLDERRVAGIGMDIGDRFTDSQNKTWEKTTYGWKRIGKLSGVQQAIQEASVPSRCRKEKKTDCKTWIGKTNRVDKAMMKVHNMCEDCYVSFMQELSQKGDLENYKLQLELKKKADYIKAKEEEIREVRRQVQEDKGETRVYAESNWYEQWGVDEGDRNFLLEKIDEYEGAFNDWKEDNYYPLIDKVKNMENVYVRFDTRIFETGQDNSVDNGPEE